MADVLWPCGTIGRPHGLKGELYLELLPHGLDYLAGDASFFLIPRGSDEPAPVSVQRAGGDDRHPLLRVQGIDSREQAAALSGAILVATGGALDEIPAWRAGDLIGLRAVSGARELGAVTDILQTPAAEVLQIEASGSEPGAQPILVPLVDELVEVDLAAGLVRVREGLLE
jgi:16S rRNA processing protein RimM